MWQFNLTVLSVFASMNSITGTEPNAQVNIAGLGWRRIASGPPESVVNVLMVLGFAATHGRTVTAFINADGRISNVQLTF
jgi:hypothetical protein